MTDYIPPRSQHTQYRLGNASGTRPLSYRLPPRLPAGFRISSQVSVSRRSARECHFSHWDYVCCNNFIWKSCFIFFLSFFANWCITDLVFSLIFLISLIQSWWKRVDFQFECFRYGPDIDVHSHPKSEAPIRNNIINSDKWALANDISPNSQ